MKRALSLVLCLCLVFSLVPAACADGEAETILGLKEGNIYLSEFLGVTAVFDEDWVLLSDEEAQEAMGPTALRMSIWPNSCGRAARSAISLPWRRTAAATA